MDSYTEQIVETKNKGAGLLIKLCSVLLSVLGILSMLFVNFLLGALMFLAGMGLSNLAGKEACQEYEYLFVNGDCEISKIINKSRRKKERSFDEGDVQRILLYNSDKFQNELQINSRMSVKNYTSHNNASKDSWYVFMINGKENDTAVVLELNEKSLQHVKDVFKRKVEV